MAGLVLFTVDVEKPMTDRREERVIFTYIHEWLIFVAYIRRLGKYTIVPMDPMGKD